ncbi:MAG TPA: hypothetical protein VIY29_03920 [Ktedonobacteraceae bacterium]
MLDQLNGCACAFHAKTRVHDPLCQMIQIREVADAQALSLQDAEPLLDLVHPRRQCDFQEVADEAGMSREPGLNLFALLDAGVTRARERCASPRQESPDRAKVSQGDEFCLAFASRGESRDLPRPRIKSGK